MDRCIKVTILSILFTTNCCLVFSIPVSQAQQSLAATLNVYVFPSDGQESSQQSKDEGECYNWAVENAGIDPFELSKKEATEEQQQAQAKQQASQAGKGRGLRGAARGAAAGALIGEIANDDAGKGAGIGATIGAVRGSRIARNEQKAAQSNVEQTAAHSAGTNEQQMGNFKKAFGACLEGKKYTVKY